MGIGQRALETYLRRQYIIAKRKSADVAECRRRSRRGWRRCGASFRNEEVELGEE
jgi:hypothetical protein